MNALDQTLLSHAQARDEHALDQVARAALPQVLRWCARLGGPRVDHEDAAHDVMLVVLRRLEQVRSVEQFESWLFSITRRVLAGHRRRAWVRRWLPGVSVDRADQGVGPLEASLIGERAHRVRLALEALPDAQKEVLVLCDLEERTSAEVAAMLDIPVGTVKSRLRLGRAAFSQAARQHGLADLEAV